jgi:hypothetical protein
MLIKGGLHARKACRSNASTAFGQLDRCCHKNNQHSTEDAVWAQEGAIAHCKAKQRHSTAWRSTEHRKISWDRWGDVQSHLTQEVQNNAWWALQTYQHPHIW